MAESISACVLEHHLLGKISSIACVIPPAPFFYCILHMALSNTLENHSNNKSLVILPPDSLEELKR